MTQSNPFIWEETDAARKIAADPRPVMIVDTCNFGNIVGLALAGKTKPIHDALHCLQDGLSRKLFHLVVPHQVHIEFTRPGQFVHSAKENLKTQIHSWNAAVQTFESLCAMPKLWTSQRSYHQLNVGEVEPLLSELVEISGQFLDQAIVVESSQQARDWAHQREIDRKRPSRQGKNSFGDCQICGTILSFLGVLRKMQFVESAFFVSENKEDFAYNDRLHPDLQADFAQVSLTYCQTIPEAYEAIWKQRTQSKRGKSCN